VYSGRPLSPQRIANCALYLVEQFCVKDWSSHRPSNVYNIVNCVWQNTEKLSNSSNLYIQHLTSEVRRRTVHVQSDGIAIGLPIPRSALLTDAQ